MKNPIEDFSFSDPFNTWWPFIIAVIVGVLTTIRSYLAGPNCPSCVNVTGKNIIITGGSSGIGLQVSVELAKREGRVIIGTRNPERAEQEFEKLRKNKGVNKDVLIKYMKLDLSSFASVRVFVENLEEERVDMLINNAGIAFHPFEKTTEGFEKHLAANYLGHFLLTHLLIPKLKLSDDARIINVSAQAHYCGNINFEDINHETEFTSNKAFGQSKLALVMMARHMAKIFEGTNIKINSMHPGLVRGTKHMRMSPLNGCKILKMSMIPWAWLLLKNAEQGAQTIIYMAVAPELNTTSGRYFSNCSVIEPSEESRNDDLAAKLYKMSCQWTQIAATEWVK